MLKKRTIWVSAVTATGVALAAAGVGLAWADTTKPGHAGAESGCDLTVLSKDLGSASAVSSSGEYIAGNKDVDDSGDDNPGPSEPVVWRDGKADDFMSTVKKVFPKARSAVARDVNSDGTAVGGATGDDDTQSWAFRYQDGKVVELKAPKGYEHASPAYINDDGTIGGSVTRSSDSVNVAATWSADGATATVLDGPDDIAVTSFGDDGTVYGYTDPYNDPKMWAVPQDGEAKRVEVADANSIVQDHVSFPVVNGDWMLADEYRWNRADGSEPTVHELTHKDENGNVVGDAYTIDGKGRVYGVDTDGKPEMGADGKVTALPLDSDKFPKASPSDVSADGHVVVGYGLTADDEGASSIPYMWTCKA